MKKYLVKWAVGGQEEIEAKTSEEARELADDVCCEAVWEDFDVSEVEETTPE